MPEHIKEIFNTLGKLPSTEDFVKLGKYLKDALADGLSAINKKVDQRLEQVRDGRDGKDGKDGAPGPKGDKGDKGERGRTFIALRGEQGDPGAPGKDGSPDTGEQIVDKINALSTDNDEDKIDASHIKNLPEPKQQNFPTVMAANGPLWRLQDVDVGGISVGQSLKWTGVRWIPYTPASSGSTSVYNEVVAGSATTFTLANTPDTDTLRLYANGQRLTPTTDYSLTGAVITTVSSWSANAITADYNYT